MQEEYLEQALKLQIQKRIEAESKASKIQSHFHDLLELIDAFVLEVSQEARNDDDEKKRDPDYDSTGAGVTTGSRPTTEPATANSTHKTVETIMDRKDVHWMLKEIQIRVQGIHSCLLNPPALSRRSPSHEKDLDAEGRDSETMTERIGYEMELAKLKGQIAQMQEDMDQQTGGRRQGGNNSIPIHDADEIHSAGDAAGGANAMDRNPDAEATKPLPQARESSSPSSSTTARRSPQPTFKVLQEKYHRLEKRHGIMLRDMQQELEDKQKRIQVLEKELERVAMTCPTSSSPSSSSGIAKDDKNGTAEFMTSPLPHKDLLIASLQEDIEERDAVIAELKEELDRYERGCYHESRSDVPVAVGRSSGGGGMEGEKKRWYQENGVIHDSASMNRVLNHHQDVDRVKIKYMEGIILSLETRIQQLEQEGCNGNGIGGSSATRAMMNVKGSGNGTMTMDESVPQCHPTDKSHLLSSSSTSSPGRMTAVESKGGMDRKAKNRHQDHYSKWDWQSGSCKLMDESLAPGGYSSLQLEDMELQIAELMARLKDSQEEKMLLEQELRQWREKGMEQQESHGPQ